MPSHRIEDIHGMADRVRRNGYADSQLDTLQQRLQQASQARAQESAGGEVLYSGGANLSDEQIAKLPFDLYRQGYEYWMRIWARWIWCWMEPNWHASVRGWRRSVSVAHVCQRRR